MSDLRALAARATPGPWTVGYRDGSGMSSIVAEHEWDRLGLDAIVVMGGSPEGDIEYGVTGPDAAWIAACDPDTILALLDRAERAEAALGSLRSGLIEVIRLSPDAPGAAYAKQVLASLESVK